ncbi:MAG: 23S rRNA (pseudouridine(1915)-N(3))-methyltransferase RlmH [Limnochordia bacterium]
MRMRIIAVGKIKERFLRDGIAEYGKRLGRYGRFEVVEIKEESFKEPLNEREKQQVMEAEGERILARLNPRAYVVVLDRLGEQWSSQELAERMGSLAVGGTNQMDFVIGGSLGLAPQVLTKADFIWSFSKLTFPHQLMRLMLAEQIYRAQTIIAGESYHK